MILPLWGPNGVKNAALEQTQAVFESLVAFYVAVLMREPGLWDKVPKRDRQTGTVLFDPETGEIRLRAPTADAVLTRAAALTVKTSAHPDPSYDLAAVPGAARAPVVFRRAAIKRAIGLVRSHRSNLARWERRGGPGTDAGDARHAILPGHGVPGFGLDRAGPAASPAFVSPGEAVERGPVGFVRIPVRIPERVAPLLAVSEDTHARIEAGLAEARALDREGRTEDAKVARKHLKPLPWEIAQASVTLCRHADGWAAPVPFVRTVPVRKAEDQRRVHPGLPVTTVDLGENHLAVAAAWKGSQVTGTLFVSGSAHEERRMRRLSAIRQRQKASGKPTKGVRANRQRWVRLTHAEADTARQIARRIVDFAKAHGSRVVVFEALHRIPSTRHMGWTRRQNLRRSWWMRGRILAHARAMVLWEGILVVRRDPAFTSKTCPRCGSYGERFSQRADGRGPRHMFRCRVCGWEGHADLVGALNLKRKWDRVFPPLGPLIAAAKEAKPVKTAPAVLGDKGAVGCAANAG
jgi:putative transposase